MSASFTSGEPARRALLLINLGSPSAPTVPAVRVFLREFLSDPCVVPLPAIVRALLLRLVVLPFRAKKSAARYAKIWTREGSPLAVETERLRERVAAELGGEIRVLAAMRYGAPNLESAARELLAAGTRDVFAIPLFPQSAESSRGTAIQHARKVFSKIAPSVGLRFAEPFFKESAYIAALAEKTAETLRGNAFDKLLISFHALPESAPEARNYARECRTTAELLAAALALPRERVEVVFQSRVGHGKWLAPATEERLRALPAEGAKRVAVVAPGFVADCLETLEELGVRGREIFLAAGGNAFTLVPCLNDSPAFAKFLAKSAFPREFTTFP